MKVINYHFGGLRIEWRRADEDVGDLGVQLLVAQCGAHFAHECLVLRQRRVRVSAQVQMATLNNQNYAKIHRFLQIHFKLWAKLMTSVSPN